jgi:hypothetical protein
MWIWYCYDDDFFEVFRPDDNDWFNLDYDLEKFSIQPENMPYIPMIEWEE